VRLDIIYALIRIILEIEM